MDVLANLNANPKAESTMPTTKAMSRPYWGSSSPAITLMMKTAQMEQKEKRSYKFRASHRFSMRKPEPE